LIKGEDISNYDNVYPTVTMYSKYLDFESTPMEAEFSMTIYYDDYYSQYDYCTLVAVDIDADMNPRGFDVKGNVDDCSFTGSFWKFQDDGENGEIQGPDGTWYVLYTEDQRYDYSMYDDYNWDEYDEYNWDDTWEEYDYMYMDDFADYDWSADFSPEEYAELAALEAEMAMYEDFDFNSFDMSDFGDFGDFDFGGW
jgi:hypothetical protein